MIYDCHHGYTTYSFYKDILTDMHIEILLLNIRNQSYGNLKVILFIYLYRTYYQGIQKEHHPWVAVHGIDQAYWY